MRLTDLKCRNAKAEARPRKLSDGGGLYLLVQPAGSKLWRQAYRFDGKQKTVSLGAYPLVSLAEARMARDEHKKLLVRGIDPSAQRKLDRFAARGARADTFKLVAEELLEKFGIEGNSEETLSKKRWLLGFLYADARASRGMQGDYGFRHRHAVSIRRQVLDLNNSARSSTGGKSSSW